MITKITRVIRDKDMDAYTGLGRTQRLELERRGEFPRAIFLSDTGRAKGYLEEEVLEWQRLRASKRAQSDNS